MSNHKTMKDLFDQLGLPSSDDGIDQFIESHQSIPANLLLYKAEGWSKAQSQFLDEAWHEDSDWVGVIEELNERLR